MPIDPICATGRRCADCGCLPDSGRGGKCNCSDPGCQCSGSNTTTACTECNGRGWVEIDRCNCGVGPSGHFGAHERHCGLEECHCGAPFVSPTASVDLTDDFTADSHTDLDPGELGMMSDSEFYDRTAEYRQSTTACCPRETIPDSCSCLEGCGCLCRDCECGTGCDCCTYTGDED